MWIRICWRMGRRARIGGGLLDHVPSDSVWIKWDIFSPDFPTLGSLVILYMDRLKSYISSAFR